MDWLSLALLCAFAFASADAMTKRFLSDYRAHEMVIVRFTFPGLLLLPLMLSQPLPTLPLDFWWWVAGLVPLEIIAMLIYVVAIRESPLALTLPYLSFTPVFNTLTGYLMLGETVTLQGTAGILLVVGGAWLLNLESARENLPDGKRFTLLSPFHAIFTERGSRMMLLVAFLYSFTSVLGKGALQYTDPFFFGTFYYVNIGLAVLLIFAVKYPGSYRTLWRRPGPNFLVGGLMAVMILAHFYAIQLIEVAYMIAVKRTSLLFGMIYGVLLFKEHTSPLQFLAGAVMVCGVAMIAW